MKSWKDYALLAIAASVVGFLLAPLLTEKLPPAKPSAERPIVRRAQAVRDTLASQGIPDLGTSFTTDGRFEIHWGDPTNRNKEAYMVSVWSLKGEDHGAVLEALLRELNRIESHFPAVAREVIAESVQRAASQFSQTEQFGNGVANRDGWKVTAFYHWRGKDRQAAIIVDFAPTD